MLKVRSVLLVDDDTDDRELFEMALDEIATPTRFFYACDGEDALKQVTAADFEQPDYIFLDLNMPRMNGVVLLEEMRRLQLFPGTPVYVYTTSSGGPDIEKCLKMGGNLFTKHNSFRELVNDLRTLIV